MYRVREGVDRDSVISLLDADDRVESVQRLQQFETRTDGTSDYNDPYAEMQYGLKILDITAAHRRTQPPRRHAGPATPSAAKMCPLLFVTFGQAEFALFIEVALHVGDVRMVTAVALFLIEDFEENLE